MAKSVSQVIRKRQRTAALQDAVAKLEYPSNKMPPLVSILIPCHNAERWVAEAIESCLKQSYAPVEVIVVDDGSTDGSLGVIQSFGDRIRWETGPNRGGNHARNRAFALSKGDFIQYLDADDYLLPQKVESQAGLLERSDAGLIYGDWQRFLEAADGARTWMPVEITGQQPDVLESLLSGWVPPLPVILFKREALTRSGGWDETVTSAQDLELDIRLAMSGVVFRYEPGCQIAVRRPAVPTVSTRNHRRNDDNVERMLKAAEGRLVSEGRLAEIYQRAMARNYFKMARNYFDNDRARFRYLLSEARRLSSDFVTHESRGYGLLVKWFGVAGAEQLCSIKRRMRGVRQNA